MSDLVKEWRELVERRKSWVGPAKDWGDRAAAEIERLEDEALDLAKELADARFTHRDVRLDRDALRAEGPMGKTVWVVRSLNGAEVDICPGGGKPWTRGVYGIVSYRVAKSLGFTGLRPGQSRRITITVTEAPDAD